MGIGELFRKITDFAVSSPCRGLCPSFTTKPGDTGSFGEEKQGKTSHLSAELLSGGRNGSRAQRGHNGGDASSEQRKLVVTSSRVYFRGSHTEGIRRGSWRYWRVLNSATTRGVARMGRIGGPGAAYSSGILVGRKKKGGEKVEKIVYLRWEGRISRREFSVQGVRV